MSDLKLEALKLAGQHDYVAIREVEEISCAKKCGSDPYLLLNCVHKTFANRIIKCVNMHDELVEGLKKARVKISDFAASNHAEYCGTMCNDDCHEKHLIGIDELLQKEKG